MTDPLPPTPLVCAEPMANCQRLWAGWYFTSSGSDNIALDAWRKQPAIQLQLKSITAWWADQVQAGAVERADHLFPPSASLTSRVCGHWYLKTGAGSHAHSARKAQALQLLQLVHADADTHELENIFRQDPTLTYQLLKLVNAAGTSGGRRVSSFSQAILLLGRQTLHRWLQLMVFAARDDDPRSALLLPHVVLRARGMELLCLHAGGDRHAQEEAFIAGMLSMLGVLFGQPLAEVIAPLALGSSLQTALTLGEGDIGDLLTTWKTMETADFAGLAARLLHHGLDASTFNQLLLQACHWVEQSVPSPSLGRGHA